MTTVSRKKKKRLVLLDAHAILHRAYHALPDFTSTSGEPTGALYGFVAMLLKIVDDLKPDYIIACYDLPGGTYRHDAFEHYKAGREKLDDALSAQIERSRDVLKVFSVPIYEKAGYEADDILGTIVERLKGKKEVEIVIASGDMDTLQLVDGDRVRVYTLRKGIKDTVIYDEPAVVSRFGFGPKLLPDYKGLRGDPSDNIPGIRGIGEKTATELIVSFGSIKDLYRTLTRAPEKVREKVSARIATLLAENKEEAEFSRILGEINRDVPITFALPRKIWREAINPKAILDLFSELSFRTLSDRVRSMFRTNNSGVISETKQPEKPIDPLVLKETAIALWVLNSEHINPTREDIMQYAKADTLELAQKQIFESLKKEGTWRVFEDIERPLMPVVDAMETRGIAIDKKYLKRLSTEYHQALNEYERDIHALAGESFNISSPRQLGVVLYEKLGLKAGRKTATGARSTRESELSKLSEDHPIIEKILRYRELQKLLSTYIDNLPAMAGTDGRLHAHFSQSGSTTGRMSSSAPNLQNIPIRTEYGKRVRNAFVAEKDYILASFDYSQIELRVSAFLSGDERMADIFRSGGDIHTAVASEVFFVEPKDVTDDMRRRAKVINFGIHYGMGVVALAHEIGATRADAERFLKNYFERFSGLARYIERSKREAHKKGYTETHFGRRRHLPGIHSKLPYIRAEAERMAVNAPIQGTQADIVKIAMRRVNDFLSDRKLPHRVRLVLQIHDELIYEVNEKIEHTVLAEIQRIMESVISKDEMRGIPLKVDISTGKNWGEMKANH